ncbi:MAG: hypothetical protein IPM54_00640 [Polyangiaceae bacterium]|nr:hypothetical protein [Polyangiaceae bacterium]
MVRRTLSLFFAVIVSAVALRAEATPAKRIAVRLDYQAPEPSHFCPSSDELGFMLAAEFGYAVVRDDARGVLTVHVRVVDDKYQAELSAPNPSGTGENWRWNTDKQATCRELAYDVATTVGIAFGPRAWANGEPPETLAAPPPVIDVHSSAVLRERPRLVAKYVSTVSRTNRETTGTTAGANADTPMQMEAALGPAVTLYGLPSVAIGGSGLLALRWTRFAIGLDIRGVITPMKGIGEREVPGRTQLWTFSLLPCGSARVLDICGIASLSTMRFELDDTQAIREADGFSAGFGARISPRWKLSDTFTLAGYADLTGELRAISIGMTQSAQPGGPAPDWISPQVRASLGVIVTTAVVK